MLLFPNHPTTGISFQNGSSYDTVRTFFPRCFQGRLLGGAAAEVPPGDPLRDRGPPGQFHRLHRAGPNAADAQTPGLC